MKEYKKIIQEQEGDVVKAQEKARKEQSGTLGPSETRSAVPIMRVNLDLFAEAKVSERQALSAQKRRGTESPLKRAIRIIMRDAERYELGEFLAIIEPDPLGDEPDNEYILNLYESTIESEKIDIYSIDVCIESSWDNDMTGGVVLESGHITYLERGKEERKEATFKTIRNHLSAIKAEQKGKS